MANIPHLTLAQPRAAEAGRSEESKHCPALRDGATNTAPHQSCRNKTGCNYAITTARHLPNQSSFKKKNLSSHFMFQHCQPMRNHHSEELQRGNGKINSEKVSGHSSSIQLVSPPYIISPCKTLSKQNRQYLQ